MEILVDGETDGDGLVLGEIEVLVLGDIEGD